MPPNLAAEVATLRRMTVKQLRLKDDEAFGEPTRSGNQAWLVKRVAWRLQARAEGGLSERARRRADELADDADLRLRPTADQPRPEPDPAGQTATVPLPGGDSRLPPPGSVITRVYKGQTLQVHVRDDGLEYDGRLYRSLSAVARAVTGGHCNGFLFFKLHGERS